MSIIFGLAWIVFLITALAGFLFCVIYMARKVGFLKPTEVIEGQQQGSFNGYLANFQQINNKLVFRFGLIVLLVALLNIPLNMVSEIVMERSQLYHKVLDNIASTWGHKQKLQGPVLLVPYTEKFTTTKILTDKDGNERKVNKTAYQHKTAIVLPNALNIDVNLAGQTRKRGLYESLVYTSDLTVTGSFTQPNIMSLSNLKTELIYLSDLKTIKIENP